MEYLAVVRLRAIAQEAEVEQAKAQEATLKKAIGDPSAGAVVKAPFYYESVITLLVL
jgi:hypothetical protein